ncbi:hypothetical protein AB0I94_24725 [Streptomyces sp. NPDC050147]|uniref:hypothetical protein n=1 Tax=Streptomyces sp. NPDC050147 TaxID=3155513 RepID=UPI0034368A41
MITAWSPSRVLRSRSTAIPLRLLGLGLILFGLLYAHAASPESTARHLASGSVTSAAIVGHVELGPEQPVATATRDATEAPVDHHGGDGHGRQSSLDECGLGQPAQGPVLGLPCLTSLGSAAETVVPPLVHVRPSAVRGFVVPIPHAAESPVLRI